MSNSKYQEALDRLLNDDYDFSHDFYEEDKATTMERDIDTLQELVDKTTWIPVEERLPKDEHRALVQLSNEWQQVAWHDGIEWILLSDEAEPIENHYRKVIAWMPLPTPYLGSER